MRLERGPGIKKSGFEQSKTPHFEGVSLHSVLYKGFLRTSKLDDFLPWTSILSKGRTRCHTKGTWTSYDVESSQARKTSPENKPILIFNLSICNCWHYIKWFQIQNLSSTACQILLNEFVPNKCKKEKKSNQIKFTCLETYHVCNVLMKRHMLVKKAKGTGTTLQKISLKKNNE